jgi:hypothetical protein
MTLHDIKIELTIVRISDLTKGDILSLSKIKPGLQNKRRVQLQNVAPDLSSDMLRYPAAQYFRQASLICFDVSCGQSHLKVFSVSFHCMHLSPPSQICDTSAKQTIITSSVSLSWRLYL